MLCESDIETTEHLFYQCIQNKNPATLDNIIFGVILKDSQAKYILNNLLLLSKYFIHSCKWKKVKPIFSVFKRQLKENCWKSLKLMKSKNALSLIEAFKNMQF